MVGLSRPCDTRAPRDSACLRLHDPSNHDTKDRPTEVRRAWEPAARTGSAIFSSARKSERRQLADFAWHQEHLVIALHLMRWMLRRCIIAARWWGSKFQANIVTSKRTTVSYVSCVSCGTHPAAWPRRKPRSLRVPCYGGGASGTLIGWFASNAVVEGSVWETSGCARGS